MDATNEADIEATRAEFEELVYARYFTSQIGNYGVGPLGLDVAPDTVEKKTLLLREADGCYAEKHIDAMWYGWCLRQRPGNYLAHFIMSGEAMAAAEGNSLQLYNPDHAVCDWLRLRFKDNDEAHRLYKHHFHVEIRVTHNPERNANVNAEEG